MALPGEICHMPSSFKCIVPALVDGETGDSSNHFFHDRLKYSEHRQEIVTKWDQSGRMAPLRSDLRVPRA